MGAASSLIPPFTTDSAIAKVRAGEDLWNTRDPKRVALGYTPDSWWRNRSTFLQGRAQIIEFLTAKWASEHNYRLIKEIWAHGDDRIAVRFAYEYHDGTGPMVPRLRQRELGVRSRRADEDAPRQYQRHQHHRQ